MEGFKFVVIRLVDIIPQHLLEGAALIRLARLKPKETVEPPGHQSYNANAFQANLN